jgi:hypothetical protein
MYPLSLYLGQARLAEFHEQAERDALARAARRARREQRPRSGHGGPGFLAAVIAAARRPAPAPEGPC